MSTLTLESARFGRVEIDSRTVVEFPDGLIGLEGTRYALLATTEASDFAWLHSLDDPTLALPVTNPHRFFPQFSVELTDGDAERLAIGDASVDVYVTVRAAAARQEFTANLRAPLLIWDGRGYQVINQAEGADLRAPLFPEPQAAS